MAGSGFAFAVQPGSGHRRQAGSTACNRVFGGFLADASWGYLLGVQLDGVGTAKLFVAPAPV